MSTTAPDFKAITERQQDVWSSGDFGRVGALNVLHGELLCESLDVHPGERVLDVAAGSGVASLAAARRWADVTSTDFVPDLLEQAKRRAEADGLRISTQIADAQNLPSTTSRTTSSCQRSARCSRRTRNAPRMSSCASAARVAASACATGRRAR